jgi:rhodanese-related sulfurtransferase
MVETLTITQLAEVLESTSYDLVDVRDASEYAAGHIPGVRNLPLDQLRADPETALPKRDGIIFICARGVRSLTAAKIAERLGYTTLFNLEGGTIAWAKAGHPVLVPQRAAA